MELRVLQYFLAVCQEESISKAAHALYLSQPTLSRQLKDLEKELGKQLFIRGNRKITLTDEGMLLKDRAEEILTLVHKTKEDISLSDADISGEVVIGAAETRGLKEIIEPMKDLRERYPQLHFSIISGDHSMVKEQLENGLIDFGVVSGDIDRDKYAMLPLAAVDHIGLLMRNDDPLSDHYQIAIEDMKNLPLIVSRQMLKEGTIEKIMNCSVNDLNIAAATNLLFNASLMVEEGIGYAICYEGIINTTGTSSLTFRRLSPEYAMPLKTIWKNYIKMSKGATKFLEVLRTMKN